MKAFRIDMDGVAEVDVPEDFLRTSEQTWDCFELDAGHYVWVDDEGLFADKLELACVGSNGTAALPAYVLGASGGKTVGATMSLEDARAQVSNLRRSGPLTFSVESA
jgi:hypothetical protein